MVSSEQWRIGRRKIGKAEEAEESARLGPLEVKLAEYQGQMKKRGERKKRTHEASMQHITAKEGVEFAEEVSKAARSDDFGKRLKVSS